MLAFASSKRTAAVPISSRTQSEFELLQPLARGANRSRPQTRLQTAFDDLQKPGQHLLEIGQDGITSIWAAEGKHDREEVHPLADLTSSTTKNGMDRRPRPRGEGSCRSSAAWSSPS